MRVLAIDTATSATAVALVDLARSPGPGAARELMQDGLSLEARDDPPAGARPRHAQRLLALSATLAARGGGFQTIDRIAVGIGPGTFTGLRIGIASAQALARTLAIPLLGVSTLQSLALGAGDGHEGGVLALLDARRGELFAAGWAPGSDPRHDPAAVPACVLKPDQLRDTLAELGLAPLVVGDGAVKLRADLERLGAVVPPNCSTRHRVCARLHCSLVAAAAPGPVELILPVYLRAPDATIARRSPLT